MIRSMTGFGKAEATLANNKKITVEIRTLNSKQIDLSLKMPAAYRSAEAEVRSIASKGIGRGKADIYISVSQNAAESLTKINKPLFKEYFNQIVEACKEAGFDGDVDNSTVLAVLRMPDVISVEQEQIDDSEIEIMKSCVSDAIAHLNIFREQEGAILMDDLLRRVSLIEGYKEDVIPFEQARIEVIKERIRENIEKHAIAVDSNRFEAEMIFYVEKLDITEEKVRLNNHCNYFREVAAKEEGAGRKLGFITQEMGREINTMGSKANNAEIQRLVVQMKDELEKIKEQVLNIL
ncbi:MAG: YicC/YloC family endoribonuclease [Rikenellaceae bacterium]